MLAAVGRAEVEVWRQPRVAIISTGDEIIAPGAPMRPGAVYDSMPRSSPLQSKRRAAFLTRSESAPMTMRC